MAGRTDSARAALRNVDKLHEVYHEPILRELDRQGLLDEPRGSGFERTGNVRATAAPVLPERECLTCIEVIAANEDNAVRVRRVIAEAKRLGFEIRANQKIDIFKMDEALKGKDVERRMTLKKNLAAMRLIP
jgi:hypothetical protein